MATKPKKSIAKDTGAPQGLITSLLVGVPFLAALVLHDSLSLTQSFFASIAMTALLIQGLSLCFYWRRIAGTKYKTLVAGFFVSILWFYMVGITAAGIASGLVPSEIDYLRSITSICLVLGSLSGILFAVIWGLESKGRARTQSLGLSLLVAALAVLVVGSANMVENMERPDRVVLSAKDFDSTSGHAVAPQQPIAPKMKMAAPPVHHVEKPLVSQHVEPKKPQPVQPKAAAKPIVSNTHWTYEGATGPESWSKVSPDYALCSQGVFQSPVEISKASKILKHATFKYKKTPVRVIDNGHTVKLNYRNGSFVNLKGRQYELRQLHFHSPSEHTLNGVNFPLEVHMVHEDSQGRLAFIGVFVEQGKRNPSMDKILNIVPREPGVVGKMAGVSVSASDFLPKSKTLFHYSGSLTTPPCSEGVNWNVMAQPIQMSVDQVAAFRRLYKGNNRPVQDLGDRKIGSSSFSH